MKKRLKGKEAPLLRTTADYRPVNSASISVQFWLQLGCDFVGICWGFWLGGKCNFERNFDCYWIAI